MQNLNQSSKGEIAYYEPVLKVRFLKWTNFNMWSFLNVRVLEWISKPIIFKTIISSIYVCFKVWFIINQIQSDACYFDLKYLLFFKTFTKKMKSKKTNVINIPFLTFAHANQNLLHFDPTSHANNIKSHYLKAKR